LLTPESTQAIHFQQKGEINVPELIETFEEALDNARAFQSIGEHTDSKAYINLDHFFHWYYFPTERIYAPAKFIAYRNSTPANYSSHERHLHDAQKALEPWFERVGEDDATNGKIVTQLEAWLETHGAHLHEHSRTVTGGVYTPR
jgi:hypothetical protein